MGLAVFQQQALKVVERIDDLIEIDIAIDHPLDKSVRIPVSLIQVDRADQRFKYVGQDTL